MSYVAGYTVAHDVSARDLQFSGNSGQWLLSKSFDTFCPIGPVLVTPDGLSGRVELIYCSTYHDSMNGLCMSVEYTTLQVLLRIWQNEIIFKSCLLSSCCILLTDLCKYTIC